MTEYDHFVEKVKEKASISNNWGDNNAGAVASIAYALLALAEAVKYHADVTAPILPREGEFVKGND